MAGERHTSKKGRAKTNGKNSRGGGKVSLGIKINARSRLAAKKESGLTAPEKKLPEQERKKIVRRIMAKERKRGHERREGTDSGETEQVERQKRLIMWSGVTFFMVLIAVFWIYTFKLNVESSYSPPARDASLSSRLQDMTAELEKQVGQINAAADKIDEFSQENDAGSATSSGIFAEPSGFPDEIQTATGTAADSSVRGTLEQLENKLKNSD